jgi:ethanolamine-phosphate cytidylyltransferase
MTVESMTMTTTTTYGSNDAFCPNDNDNVSMFANAILMSESILELCSESSLFSTPVSLIHHSLGSLGLPEDDLPTPLTIFRVFIVIIITLIVYYICLGKRHMKNRKALNRELRLAQERVRLLQEKLDELDREDYTISSREVRIFMDGAFDMLHYGHMNAFRLARSLGTHLIVGVNSDESITRCKGAPLMTDQERLTMVKTCKFVDDVVEDCPYVMSPEYLEWVIREYKIDYVVHGSDPCFTLDGQDVYASAKAKGKFRNIPRTEGVSTSDILGRILVMTREHHIYNRKEEAEEESQRNVLGHKSQFLTTSLLLKSFSAGVKAPKKDSKIIYIDGTWDLFHPGHVAILKSAREVSEMLSEIAAIHCDSIVVALIMGLSFVWAAWRLFDRWRSW